MRPLLWLGAVLTIAAGGFLWAWRTPDVQIESSAEANHSEQESPRARPTLPGEVSVIVEPETDPASSATAAPPVPDGLHSIRAEASPPVDLAAPGSVAFDAIDAVSLDRISAELRLISADRYVRRSGTADSPRGFELQLTPGEYSGTLHNPGYDPTEIPTFEVASGSTTDLAQIGLQPGSAVIEVRLLGVANMVTWVEVYGPPRRACGQCPDRSVEGADPDSDDAFCSQCGSGVDRARVSPRGGLARIDRLAAGEYRVAARSDTRGLLAVDEVELASGETRSIDLEIRQLDVDFLLTDRHGDPFDGIWTEDGERFSADILLYFSRQSTAFAAARFPAPPLLGKKGEMTLEPSEDAESVQVTLPAVSGERERAANPDDRHDRARRPGHSPWPPPLDPKLRTEPLVGVRVGAGRVRVRDLPVTVTRVLLTCGPQISNTVDLDLTSWDGQPIEIQILERCNVPAEMVRSMGANSCMACHMLPQLKLMLPPPN